MALVVHKYGGTSVATPEKIKRVAKRIAKARRVGDDVIAVVSAMGQMTDELVDLAHAIAPHPSAREMDMLLSSGERITAALTAMALQEMGFAACSLTGPQAGFRTDEWHTKARIASIDPTRIQQHLDNGEILIVCGFQGMNARGDISTLGRGGSDTSAVALAAAFNAVRCEICTDVAGVYTADPRVVPEARKLDRITYDEMLELASMGASVLQIRSVQFGKRYGVPLYICSTHSDEPGTMVIDEEPTMEQVVIEGLALEEHEAKVSLEGVPDRPGIAARVFEAIAEHNIVVDMIVQSTGSDGVNTISFTVPDADLNDTKQVVEDLVAELGAQRWFADPAIAKVSAVGVGMRSHSGTAARMFKALADANINIEMISTSEIKISCVVHENDGKKALRVLHEAFELDRAPAERST